MRQSRGVRVGFVKLYPFFILLWLTIKRVRFATGNLNKKKTSYKNIIVNKEGHAKAGACRGAQIKHKSNSLVFMSYKNLQSKRFYVKIYTFMSNVSSEFIHNYVAAATIVLVIQYNGWVTDTKQNYMGIALIS